MINSGLLEGPRSKLERLGWSSEVWLSKEMIVSAQGGNMERAENTFRALSSLENLKWPPSYYKYQFAVACFPEGGSQFRAALLDWIEDAPSDRWTPVLLFHVATDSKNEGHDLEAMGYYWRLVNEYRDVLLELEHQAVQKGEGGYLATALSSLVRILSREGMESDAIIYALDFLELFPNDERANEMKRFLGVDATLPLEMIRDFVASDGAEWPKTAISDSASLSPKANSRRVQDAIGLREHTVNRTAILWPIIAVVLLAITTVSVYLRIDRGKR